MDNCFSFTFTFGFGFSIQPAERRQEHLVERRQE